MKALTFKWEKTFWNDKFPQKYSNEDNFSSNKNQNITIAHRHGNATHDGTHMSKKKRKH